MLALGLMLGLAGIILLIAALAQAIQNRSFTKCSESVIGTITRKRSRQVQRGHVNELSVSYTVNGVDYERIVGTHLSEMNEINIGDSIELYYKPDNPKKVIRPFQLEPRNVKILLIFGLALTVAGVLLFCFR